MLICSGFSPSGYVEYGRRFIATFDQHWPSSIGLVVYGEEPIPMPRGTYRSLWDCEGASQFFQRHRDDPRRCGRDPIPGWGSREKQIGYSWRFDAVKFFRQCLIPDDAAQSLKDGDILVWLDADIVTIADIPGDFITSLLGDGDLAYLRAGKDSEIGFWAVRLNNRSRAFLRELADFYREDRFLAEPAHHSGYIFDCCRERAEPHGLIAVNISTAVHGNHPWMQSPLMNYLDHLKGQRRKRLGFSPEHPLQWWKRL